MRKVATKPAGWPRAVVRWATVLLPWLALLTVLHRQHWGRGPVVFAGMLGLATLALVARRLVARLPRREPRLLAVLAIGLVAVAALTNLRQLAGVLAGSEREIPLADIGANTFAAGHWIMEGENPYAQRAQLIHRVEHRRGVTQSPDGKLLMWGLPYDYGYPYFPVMFLWYLPFLSLPLGLHGIRLGNAVLAALTCIAIHRLLAALRERASTSTADLQTARDMAAAPWLGILAYLAWGGLGVQLFQLGVTDGVVALLATCGFWALARGRNIVAGLLLGTAQAAKLLPGPLLVLPAFLWLLGDDRRGAARLLLSYAVVAVGLVLPFALLDPARFVTSTIFFYLSMHAGGDSTSLWYFLPQALRTPFLVAGWGLALATIGLGWLRGRTLGGAVSAAFASYVLLTAFSPMSHLNYLVAVLPLGAVALAAGAVEPRQAPGGAMLAARA